MTTSPDTPASPPRKVLLVKFGAIGDALMLLPAAHLLHQAGSEIHWLCGPAVAPLLDLYPWIHLHIADDRSLLRASLPARARAFAKLWRHLLPHRFDLVATLYYDPRYRLLTLPVRARRRLQLSRSDRRLQLIPDRHHTDEFARILLGWPDTCRDTSLPPLAPKRLPPAPLPSRSTTAEGTPRTRIALIPGGASNMLRQQTLRRWPAEHYAAVAQNLLARDFEVLLLGGPDDTWVRPHFSGLTLPPKTARHPDSELAEGEGPRHFAPAELQSASPGHLLDAIGTLSLPEVIAACNTCAAVVSHDTGPMHLAGLSTASILALFGPTSPGSFLPRRPGVRAIHGGEGFACRPCYDGRDFAPCADNGCMRQITPAMVLGELDSLLSERAHGLLTPHHTLQPSQTWTQTTPHLPPRL